MGENPRQDLVDQQVFEGAGCKRREGTTLDSAAVIDEKRREPRETEAIGVAFAGARQHDIPVRRSPMVIPSFIGASGPMGRVDPNTEIRDAAFSLRKRRKQHIALEDEIREPVEHG